MWTFKRNRDSSLQRAFGGLVAGLFGILWTAVAIHLMANSPFPWGLQVLFPAFGVLLTISAWGQAAFHFIHATSQQRFAEDDFVAAANPLAEEPKRSLSDRPRTSTASNCANCQAPLQPTFLFCPFCARQRI